MTLTVVIMIIIGIIFIFASFFLTDSLTRKQENFSADLLTVNEDYEFSEREKGIIKRKVEDAIAQQARDILYETNESLSNMANEKTMALGDYAVTVCEEIERNHKEVMFLYSMLEDKQKDIMHTVDEIAKSEENAKKTIQQVELSIQNSQKESVVKPDTVVRAKDIANKTETKTLEDAIAMSENVTKDNTKQKKQATKVEETKNTVKTSDVEASNKAENNKDDEQVQAIEKTEDAAANVQETDSNKKDKVSDNAVSEEENTKEEVSEESMEEIEDVLDELDIDSVELDDELEEEFANSGNSNDIILEMHRNGDSILTIAKELGLGVGEVKLVIDLYEGE